MNWRRCWVAVGAALVVINGGLIYHAWQFTHPGGDRAPGRPEVMTWEQRLAAMLLGARPARPQSTPTLMNEDAMAGIEVSQLSMADGLGDQLPGWWLRPQQPPLGTVILLHGYGGSSRAMLGPARQYLQAGLQVVLLDLPGHGRSPHQWTGLGQREAAMLSAAVEHRSWQRPLLLHGRSMGAVAVVRALGNGLAADGAVLEAPYASLTDTVCRRFELMGLPCTPLAPMLVFWGKLLVGANPLAKASVDYAETIVTPVLLLGGEQDRRVPPAVLEDYAQRWGGENTLVLFAQAGHLGLETSDPERYALALSRFVRARLATPQSLVVPDA